MGIAVDLDPRHFSCVGYALEISIQFGTPIIERTEIVRRGGRGTGKQGESGKFFPHAGRGMPLILADILRVKVNRY
jgi:hypothetical protein